MVISLSEKQQLQLMALLKQTQESAGFTFADFKLSSFQI